MNLSLSLSLSITFAQRRSNVFDVCPTLYKCHTNVSCMPRGELRGADDLMRNMMIGGGSGRSSEARNRNGMGELGTGWWGRGDMLGRERGG